MADFFKKGIQYGSAAYSAISGVFQPTRGADSTADTVRRPTTSTVKRERSKSRPQISVKPQPAPTEPPKKKRSTKRTMIARALEKIRVRRSQDPLIGPADLTDDDKELESAMKESDTEPDATDDDFTTPDLLQRADPPQRDEYSGKQSLSSLIREMNEISKKIDAIRNSNAADDDIDALAIQHRDLSKKAEKASSGPRNVVDLEELGNKQKSDELISLKDFSLPVFYRSCPTPAMAQKHRDAHTFVLNYYKQHTKDDEKFTGGYVPIEEVLGHGGVLPKIYKKWARMHNKTVAEEVYKKAQNKFKDMTTTQIVEKIRPAAYLICVNRANQADGEGLQGHTPQPIDDANKADASIFEAPDSLKEPIDKSKVRIAHSRTEKVQLTVFDAESRPSKGAKNDSVEPENYSADFSVVDDVTLVMFYLACSQYGADLKVNLTAFMRKKINGEYKEWPYDRDPEVDKMNNTAPTDPFQKAFFDRFADLCSSIANLSVLKALNQVDQQLAAEMKAANVFPVKLAAQQQKNATAKLLESCKEFVSQVFSKANRDEYLNLRLFLPANATEAAKQALMNSLITNGNGYVCPVMVPIISDVLDFIEKMMPGLGLELFLRAVRSGITYSAVKDLKATSIQKKTQTSGILGDAVGVAGAAAMLSSFGLGSNSAAGQEASKAAEAAQKVIELGGYTQTVNAYSSIVEDCVTGKKIILYPLRYSSEFTYCVMFYTTQVMDSPYCFPFGKTHPPLDWVYVTNMLIDPTNKLNLRMTDAGYLMKLGGVKLLDNHFAIQSQIPSDFTANYESLLVRPDSTKSFSDCMARIATRLSRINSNVNYVCQLLTKNFALAEECVALQKSADEIVRGSVRPGSSVLDNLYANFRAALEIAKSEGSKTLAILNHYNKQLSPEAVKLDDLLSPFDPEFTHYVVLVVKMFLAAKNQEQSEFADWIKGEVMLAETSRTSQMAYLFRLIDEPEMDVVLDRIIDDSETREGLSAYLLKIQDNIRSAEVPVSIKINTARAQYSEEYKSLILAYQSNANETTLLDQQVEKHRKGQVKFPPVLVKRKREVNNNTEIAKYYPGEEQLIEAIIEGSDLKKLTTQIDQLLELRKAISIPYQFVLMTLSMGMIYTTNYSTMRNRVVRKGSVNIDKPSLKESLVLYSKIERTKNTDPEFLERFKKLTAIKEAYESLPIANLAPASVDQMSKLNESSVTIDTKNKRSMKKLSKRILPFDPNI